MKHAYEEPRQVAERFNWRVEALHARQAKHANETRSIHPSEYLTKVAHA